MRNGGAEVGVPGVKWESKCSRDTAVGAINRAENCSAMVCRRRGEHRLGSGPQLRTAVSSRSRCRNVERMASTSQGLPLGRANGSTYSAGGTTRSS